MSRARYNRNHNGIPNFQRLHCCEMSFCRNVNLVDAKLAVDLQCMITALVLEHRKCNVINGAGESPYREEMMVTMRWEILGCFFSLQIMTKKMD